MHPDTKTLGTIPVDTPLARDLTIIFVGRRWRVLEVRDRDRVIDVAPDHAGKPLAFGGGVGEVHEVVIRRMRDVLLADVVPPYLDDTAAEAVRSARAAYRRPGFDDTPIQPISSDQHLLVPWTGTIGTASLALVLTCLGYSVGTYDGMLDVTSRHSNTKSLTSQLRNIADGEIDLPDLVQGRARALINEKFHQYLGDDRVLSDAFSRRLDLNAVPDITQSLCTRL